MRLIPTLMIAAGVILIMAARNDKDPRNIIFNALGIKTSVPDPAPIGGKQVVGQWIQPNANSALPPGTKTVTV